MQLDTTRFGPLDIEPDAIITFTQPIIGFPERRRFVLMPGPAGSALHWLQSVEDGAAAVLTDRTGAEMLGEGLGEAALVVAEDPREALAHAAALWFGAQPATMVAVTGTNGKTSVSSFCRQLWVEMGEMAVNLGTTGVEGAWTYPLRHTTPEPITLHRALAEAAAAGVSHGAMEASSHGLDQRRLDGVVLAAAGFSNFTQDHLDYHGTMEAYFEAKMGLFDRVLGDDGVAVVNLDDPRCDSRLSINRLDQAFGVCFGAYHTCPMYRSISQEMTDADADSAPLPMISITANGRHVALRPTGS